MNDDEKKVKLLDNEASPVNNVGGSILSFSSPISPTLIDKRTVPLLYVQSPSISKTSNCNNNNFNINNNEPVSETSGTFNGIKLPPPTTLPSNGSPKFVQVQSQNQNYAYLGTLLRSSSTGKDIIPQKVLLTPVKGKDGPMARFILPRPSITSPQSNISPNSKQICRSFVVSPVSQSTFMASTLALKPPEGTSKIIQPNIIRPRSMEPKVLPTGTVVPGGITAPGKTTVPPPGLTLLKSPTTQPQCGEKPPMKIVLLDMKESSEKEICDATAEPLKSDEPQADLIEKSTTAITDDNASPTEDNPVDSDDKGLPCDNQTENDIPSPNVTTDNVEPVHNEIILNINEASTCETSAMPSPTSKDSVDPLPVQPTPDSTSLKNDVPTELNLEQESKVADPLSSLPPSSMIAKDSIICSIKEIVNAPLQSPGSSERARKRKGSLSCSVSFPAKALILGDNYENMKLLPGAEEIDPFKVIDWDELGVGKLPQSEYKVVLNDFNMLELHDTEKSVENSKDNSNKKKNLNDEVVCCVKCSCYGYLSEFFNENFCTVACRDELIAQQHAIISNCKKELEVEVPENKDKKKLTHGSPSKTLHPLPENNKNSSKSSLKSLTDGIEDKLFEKNVVEIDDSSSTDPETTSKKSLSSDEPRFSKVKKIVPKAYKMTSRKHEKLTKLSNTPISDNNENKSKIKLRPRTAGKISKVNLIVEEKIVQDLDIKPHSTPEKNHSTVKASNFRWTTYLAQTKTSPAWVKLFTNSYPSKPNRFKVGQKLEAIDPEHQSYFCIVTVAAVKGYRVKLHFDGYPSEYDFWANADSPNIFPRGFCNEHSIPLHPPPGVPLKTFDWDSYLARKNARSAPQSCFENHVSSAAENNLFKVDMKLEAVDRKNTYLVCVATVAAVMENRILIHFDSWGDLYDYWVDISSPYIRPVGWCRNNNHELTPPNGIKSENFSWRRYLRDTKSTAAPEKAFTLRPPIEFKKGMKIEAVDKRAPHLIRVSTIAEVLPYQVKISFDGFPPHFGYWVDDDSPDIHPVGWSSRAGHPLERPPTVEDFDDVKCPTPGCIGQGYLQGTKQEFHTEVKNCPYSTENLGKESALTDRLKYSNNKLKRNGKEHDGISDSDEESDEDIESIRWSWLQVRQDVNRSNKKIREEETNCKIVCISDSEEIKNISVSPLPINTNETQEIKSSIEIKSEPACSESKTSNCGFEKNAEKTELDKEHDMDLDKVKEEPLEDGKMVQENQLEGNTSIVLPKEENMSLNNDEILMKEPPESKNCDVNGMPNKMQETPSADSEDGKNTPILLEASERTKICKLEEKNALFWTIHQVSQFTRPLITCADDCFLKEGIDGPGFLMLNKNDLLDYLGLSDTDAERVFRKISMLRQKVV